VEGKSPRKLYRGVFATPRAYGAEGFCPKTWANKSLLPDFFHPKKAYGLLQAICRYALRWDMSLF
jgi:hypothetical protein